MPRGPRATKIDAPPVTVRAQYSTFQEAFVPGWDDKTGAEQKMDRVAERARLGHKMTPIGRGTLRPAR